MSSVALNPALLGVMETDAAPLRVAIFLADQQPHRSHDLAITSTPEPLISRLTQREDLIITQVVSLSSFAVGNESTVETRRFPFRTDSTIGGLIAGELHPWLVRPNVDLWYYPSGNTPVIAKTTAPSVGMVRDTIMPSLIARDPNLRRSRDYRRCVARTKRNLLRHRSILTVSQFAAGELTEFCERQGIDPPPITVTYEASPWESYRGHGFDKSDYVFHLASREPHKRTNTLLQMWHRLQTQGVELPELKMVGTLDAQGQQILASASGIALLPPCDNDQLHELIGRARALLLPSEREEFGLPALAAFYVRTPVCYVRGTAVMEVVQDPQHCGAFELDDSQSLRGAVDAVIGLSANQVRACGDTMYELFSAERVCERVIRVMRESGAKSGP